MSRDERWASDDDLLRRVLDELFTFVAMLTPEGEILYVNQSALRSVGRSATDVAGMSFAAAPWWDGSRGMRARIDEAVRRAAAGDRLHFEVLQWALDGEAHPVDLLIAPVHDDTGKILRLVATGLDITERVREQQALRKSREDLARAQAVAHVGSWRLDVRRNQLCWSDEVYRMFDLPLGTPLAYETFLSQVHPDDKERVDAAWQAALHGAPYDIEHRIIVGENEKWVREQAELEFGPGDGLLGGFGTVQDITDRKHAEQELRTSRDFIEQVMASVASAVMVLDSRGVVMRANPAASAITGYSADDLLGRPFAELVLPEYRKGIRARLSDLINRNIPMHAVEIAIRHQDGSERILMLNATGVQMGSAGCVVTAAQDITARKRMEDQIRHLAHHDPLTGLPNRRLFFDLASTALHRAHRTGRRFAVLYLDLDRFKQINDTLGHDMGDRLLMQAAERLQRKLRRSDLVARVGGDEFNVLLADIGRTESAAEVAEQVRQAFREPFLLGDGMHEVTVSIGIGIYPEDGRDLETLLARADMAMYEAKTHGRNAYHFFDPAIEARAQSRMRLEAELRHALECGELELFYQSQVHIATRDLVALEALVRWHHPQRGVRAAAEFMSVAEDCGLTVPLTRWVLATACTQLHQWQQRDAAPARVAVNLSRKQLHAPDLLDMVQRALAVSGLAANCLELEVAEETLMDDAEHAMARLQHLADMGVVLAVDDFGCGRTSLRWLQRMPIQRVKVDKSFVHGLGLDGHDLPVVRAVIGLSHDLHMGVVAEGVETAMQLSLLAQHGCDDAQGFFFESPRPAAGIEHILFTGP